MDFRKLADPKLLQWTFPRATRGKYRTAPATTRDGTKVSLQTPTLPTKIFQNGAMHTVLMTLAPDHNATHAEFVEWLGKAEEAAAAQSAQWFSGFPPPITPCMRNKGFSNTVTLRLTAFDDVQWFDRSGEHVREPDVSNIRESAAVLELNGTWITDASWGLKLRLVQLRDATGLARRKRKYVLIHDESCDEEDILVTASALKKQQMYSFLEDV